MLPKESMTIRRLSVAKMNLMCWRLLRKHKQINGAPLYRLGCSFRYPSCLMLECVCGANGPHSNRSRNTSPFSIWHFYHGEVNTVGRSAEYKTHCLGHISPWTHTGWTHTEDTVSRPNDKLRSPCSVQEAKLRSSFL